MWQRQNVAAVFIILCNLHAAALELRSLLRNLPSASTVGRVCDAEWLWVTQPCAQDRIVSFSTHGD